MKQVDAKIMNADDTEILSKGGSSFKIMPYRDYNKEKVTSWMMLNARKDSSLEKRVS